MSENTNKMEPKTKKENLFNRMVKNFKEAPLINKLLIGGGVAGVVISVVNLISACTGNPTMIDTPVDNNIIE